jgi:hypothetical protein
MNKLTMTTEGDTQIAVTRGFAAPPEAQVNGKLRYEWSNPRGDAFYLTGVKLEGIIL